jgi:hypothetical protein
MLIQELTSIQDINNIIFNLYYNTFPRPFGCHVYHDKNNQFIYGDILQELKEKSGDIGYYAINYFYDGSQFEMTSRHENYNLYQVIQNNIPINYWNTIYKGIYFDYSTVLQECLNNITYGLLINKLYGIYTTFYYNNKKYKMIFNERNSHSDSYTKYTYNSSKRQWKDTGLKFQNKLLKHNYNMYIPPDLLNDGYTLIINNK